MQYLGALTAFWLKSSVFSWLWAFLNQRLLLLRYLNSWNIKILAPLVYSCRGPIFWVICRNSCRGHNFPAEDINFIQWLKISCRGQNFCSGQKTRVMPVEDMIFLAEDRFCKTNSCSEPLHSCSSQDKT